MKSSKKALLPDLRTDLRESARRKGRKIPAPPKDLIEPILSENAVYIAKTRYSFRNMKGEPIETPGQLFWRIAYYIAAADSIYLHPKHQKNSAPGTTKAVLFTARQFYQLMASQ